MKRVCVFCGSRLGNRHVYTAHARQLGEMLAGRGVGLVFGAGHIGLMGVLADAVLANGGQAIGVIPQALVDKELAHRGLTELRIVASMHERKAVMAELADAFVALPGAFGTADELFEMLTWAQLALHAKPIGILNSAGFFDPLLVWLDAAVREGLLKAVHRQAILVAEEPGTILELVLKAALTTREPVVEGGEVPPP